MEAMGKNLESQKAKRRKCRGQKETRKEIKARGAKTL